MVRRLSLIMVAVAIGLLALGSYTPTNAADIPALVSPIAQEGTALVDSCRPTFSWAAVPEAVTYELAVFLWSDKAGDTNYKDLKIQQDPALTATIPAQALSWTPDQENCLIPQEKYIWFLRATMSDGSGEWSEGATFEVDLRNSTALVNEVLKNEINAYLSGQVQPDSPFAQFINGMQEVIKSSRSSFVMAPEKPSPDNHRTVAIASDSNSQEQTEDENSTSDTSPTSTCSARLAETGGTDQPADNLIFDGPVQVTVAGVRNGSQSEAPPRDFSLISYTTYARIGNVLNNLSGIRLASYSLLKRGAKDIIKGWGGNAYICFVPDKASALRSDYGGTLRLFTTTKSEDPGNVNQRGLSITEQGDVGINEDAPKASLHINGPENDGSHSALRVTSGTQNMLIDGNEIDAYNDTDPAELFLNNNSQRRVVVPGIRVTGGSDFSEQFKIEKAELISRPGMVVSIDPAKPGNLSISHLPYDRKVAGIISGAGGVKPGMTMGQTGTLANGGFPVALSGRVYCLVDADYAPVLPGDLLTTSETPGYAMKVNNHQRAQGAIIGKAMTPLKKGRGLVLVLVSLQ